MEGNPEEHREDETFGPIIEFPSYWNIKNKTFLHIGKWNSHHLMLPGVC